MTRIVRFAQRDSSFPQNKHDMRIARKPFTVELLGVQIEWLLDFVGSKIIQKLVILNKKSRKIKGFQKSKKTEWSLGTNGNHY